MTAPSGAARAEARRVRSLVDVGQDEAMTEKAFDDLLRRWDIEVASVPSGHPLLRGARAAWREEYPLIVVDEALSLPERRFALAHELGHRVLDQHASQCQGDDFGADEVSYDAAADGDDRVWGYSPRQRGEMDANAFASELLAPSAALRALFLAGEDAPALVRRFGVTASCLSNSLVDAVLGPAVDLAREDDESPPTGAVGLDPSQARAATTNARFALVDAGPGTGKTRTLTARVVHLLERGVAPAKILVLTFSNKAAAEAQDRIRRATQGRVDGSVAVVTFHSYALDLLRRFSAQAGLPDNPRVVDESDALLLLERALPGLGLTHYMHPSRPSLYLPSLLDAASRMRDNLLTPHDLARTVARDDEDAKIEETLKLLAAYDDVLRAHGALDYGALISRAVALLRGDVMVRTSVQQEVDHVLVDEYQDVNEASVRLIEEIVSGGAHLWTVGDVRQAIYRFRGADPARLSEIDHDFPGVVHVALDVNYRATPALTALLNAAAAPIAATPSPPWQAHRLARNGGDSAVLAVAPDERAELAGIAADLRASIGNGRQPEEHAVLCRTHALATAVAGVLEDAGLTVSYLGAVYLRPEVKDLLSLLDLVDGPDGASLLRVASWPEYAVSAPRIETALTVARAHGLTFPAALGDPRVLAVFDREGCMAMGRLRDDLALLRTARSPAAALTRYLFERPAFLRRVAAGDTSEGRCRQASVLHLVKLARVFAARPVKTDDASTGAFVRYVRRLLADGDTARQPAAIPGAVNVLTVHASKGLEFPVVYVPGLTRGRFPLRGPGGARVALPAALRRSGEDDAEDERSLFFVALSRARDRLILSRSELYHGRRAAESPFVALLRAAAALERATWPAVVAREQEREAIALDSVAVGESMPLDERAVVATMRCPRRHDYQERLQVRTGEETAYATFARALRGETTRLRETYGTPDWPASAEAAGDGAVMRWDACWSPRRQVGAGDGEDDALRDWRRGRLQDAVVAWRRRMDDEHGLGAARYDVPHTVTIEGNAVSMHIDAVETMADGDVRLVWERATARQDDVGAETVALYAAVAKEMDPKDPPAIVVRSLDSGEERTVSAPAKVLAKHQGRVRAALDVLQTDFRPATPRDAASCTRCPLVFICPR